MRRDTWAELALFAAIADAGGFTRAASAVGVSPSALSHAIRALETRLGVRLLNRTTRSVAPTQAGELLLEQLRPAIANLEAAIARIEAGRDRPAGRLRISAHRTAAVHVIQPQLARFAAAYPDVQVELAIEDGLVDIVAAGFDAGVRHEHVLDRDMISVRIGPPLRILAAASPAYLTVAGSPKTPQDLLEHRCLAYRYTSSGAIHRWRFEKDGQTMTLDPPQSFVSNDVDVLRDAALAGMGVALFLEIQVAEELSSGALVGLLEDWSQQVPANYLYYSGRRQMNPALRAFVDTMRAAAR